jgi:metallo-beta-lactamase family protein
LGNLLDGADNSKRLAIMTALQKELTALNAPVTAKVMPPVTETLHGEPSGE